MTDQLETYLEPVEVDDGLANECEPEQQLSPYEELGEFIGRQEGRIGDVYNRPDMTADEVARDLNVSTSGFVFQYRQQIAAALDGVVPTSPTILTASISALNGLKKRAAGELSAEAMELLTAHLGMLLDAKNNVPAEAVIEAEAREVEDAQREIESIHEPGIYAFSYGWYLESMLDPERSKTLIKVGRAEDIARRIAQHRYDGQKAAVPEPLVPIRAYGTEGRDLRATERMFHELLDAAGHENTRREKRARNKNEVGKEWFITNTTFLDKIAKALQLRTLFAKD